MKTNRAPMKVLTELAPQTPVDGERLEAARMACEHSIREDMASASTLTASRRGRRRWLTLGAAAAVAVVAVVVAPSVLDRIGEGGPSGDAGSGSIVAMGTEGFAPASTEATVEGECSGLREELAPDEWQAAGVGYLLDNTAGMSLNFARAQTDVWCTEPAPVLASYLGSDGAGAITSALTVWGPTAADPSDGLSGLSESASFELKEGTTATYNHYTKEPAYAGVSTVTWTTGEESWVITGSQMEKEVLEQVAGVVHAEGESANLAPVLPAMTETPVNQHLSAEAIGWQAHYGEPPVAPDCVEAACTPDRVAEMPNHLYLRVEQARVPWPAMLSTRTLDHVYDHGPAVYRIVDINGAPALFQTAGETGLEFTVSWEIAPGREATIRGTMDQHPEGILDYARELEPVTAGDPRTVEQAAT